MKYIILTCFVLLCSKALSQSDSVSVLIEKILEFYIESNDLTDFDNNTAFERLYDLAEKPLDINKATTESLSDLIFLTPIQVNAIINHRIEYGDYLYLEELQTVPELDMSSLKMLLNFVTTGSAAYNVNFRSLLASGKSDLYLKYKRVLQEKVGYQLNSKSETPYKGDRNYYYTRYRFDAGRNFKVGFTAEKDAGEPFFKSPNSVGFDFYSGFIYAANLNKYIKQLAIGDYSMSFGQGLILHNGFGVGKSAYVMSIKKNGLPIRHYSSVNETVYFRGVGTTLRLNSNLDLSMGVSYKNVDGNLNIDTTDFEENATFSSLILGGFHRTESEIAKKGSVKQRNIGSRLAYRSNNLAIGANYLQYDFDKPFVRDPLPYRFYTFNGAKLQNASIDYDYLYKNVNVFGEVAASDNGGTAQLHSMLIALDKKLDLSASFRKFDKDYQVLEANAFAEGSLPINEKGLYFGLEFRPNSEIKISGYFDQWSHEWLRFRINGPSAGKEYLIRVDYTKKRKYNVYLQYRYEEKQRNSSLGAEKINILSDLSYHRIRLNLSNKVHQSLELRARTELSFSEFDNNLNKGSLSYVDIIYKPMQKPYNFSARYALFDIENFDSRIYAFESDLLYEYAIPFFQNRGSRFYINARLKPTRQLMMEFRYANTTLNNVNTIGSGNELVRGSRRSDIKAQIKYSF
jgi:hypothetical protein